MLSLLPMCGLAQLSGELRFVASTWLLALIRAAHVSRAIEALVESCPENKVILREVQRLQLMLVFSGVVTGGDRVAICWQGAPVPYREGALGDERSRWGSAHVSECYRACTQP